MEMQCQMLGILVFISLTEEEENMDWGSTTVDWGAPVSTMKTDELVLNWNDDEDNKG